MKNTIKVSTCLFRISERTSPEIPGLESFWQAKVIEAMEDRQKMLNATTKTALTKTASLFCPVPHLLISAVLKLARNMLKTKLPRTYHLIRSSFFLNGYFIMRVRSALKQQVKQSIIAQQKLIISANSCVIMFVA